MQIPIRSRCDEAFPKGVYLASEMMKLPDFDASTKENPVQARDETGTLLWVVEVIDADPLAREKLLKVKIAADHQPVPPAAQPGTPFRQVILENLTITPWINDNGLRPKICYSLRCTGLSEPKASTVVGSTPKAA